MIRSDEEWEVLKTLNSALRREILGMRNLGYKTPPSRLLAAMGHKGKKTVVFNKLATQIAIYEKRNALKEEVSAKQIEEKLEIQEEKKLEIEKLESEKVETENLASGLPGNSKDDWF
jgi:hypothetical protein